MSTAAIVSSSANNLQNYFQTRNSDLKQLGQALSSGNLANAQAAFAQITKLGQNGPFSDGHAFISQQREQDFEAVGSALQSGDLAGAQTAFAALASTFKNGGPNSSATPAASANTASSSAGPEIILNLNSGSGTNPEQITINIGPSTTAGDEQVSLTYGSQGSTPQQLTFNVNPQSNEQIILNLNNQSVSSSTSGSSSAGGAVNVSA